ncbi:NADPH-dependent F420 reductase [Gordonia sp. CPCC 205333]|uniref:NADPH-dependent F420 reductase n=1 Tax=Gordonia sp. CPCC 205333 TaxID=3140790 RepID=UPI003AF403F2
MMRLIPPLTIGICGTGHLARALGGRWHRAGHDVVFGGRSSERAGLLAQSVGAARSGSLRDAVTDVDVAVLAVPWAGVDDMLDIVEATGGAAGLTIIDPINPVEHGVGRHLLRSGSAAEYISSRLSAANVVKAFNVYPATEWDYATNELVVPLAGDHPGSVELAHRLVRDVGATPHVLGGLDRARQLEELAGAVIGLAFAGVNPRSAVPRL